MKKVLLLMLAVLMISSAAMAEHIGLFSDSNGTNCTLAAGFNPNVYVVESSLGGTTGSRFKVTPGAGNSILAFNTTYVPIGNISNDLSLAYGQCLSGQVVLGTILMSLAGPGNLEVVAADAFPTIIYTNCLFGEFPATGGKAYVTVTGDCAFPIATQPSTWGQVKSLYR